MKDENTANKDWIESAWADFLSYLDLEKWDLCRATIDAVGDSGFELDALKMFQKLNAKIAEDDEKPYDPDDYKPEYPRE